MTQDSRPPTPPALATLSGSATCDRCNGRRTIHVLGCGGDYEDWPCPICGPAEHNRTDECYDGDSARSSDNKIGDFRKELERRLNCMSMENRSDTPNFILAQYMTDCLAAYDRAVDRREVWYGRRTCGEEQVPNDPNSETEGQ